MISLLTVKTLIRPFIRWLPLIVCILPAFVAIAAGLDAVQRRRNRTTTYLLALATLLGVYLIILTHRGIFWHKAFAWLQILGTTSSYALYLTFRIDFPTAVLVSLTITLSFITHLYTLGYMKKAVRRYTILTGSLTSVTMGFLMAEGLWTRFIGWELIGLGSCLLIGFWHREAVSARHFINTWVISQLGSMCLCIGILIIDSEWSKSATFSGVPKTPYWGCDWLIIAKYCLLVGIGIKSVQFPWSGWLSLAMTAPTPASALIHTTTAVGVGICLLLDLAPELNETMLTWIVYWGSLTAFIGACAAIIQQRTKQVLAYSTVSHLGHIMMAVGMRASDLALFHFIVHAYCKANLFLCIGAVSRFMQRVDKPDTMPYMGGLYKILPGTFLAYLIAAGSLIGIPGLAGSFSKEMLLIHAWTWSDCQMKAGHHISYLVPILGWSTTLMSVIYMGRQCYLIFMDKPRWLYPWVPNHSYRTSWLMQVSMLTLAMCPIGFWHGSRLAQIPRLSPMLNNNPTSQHTTMLTATNAIALGLLVLVLWRLMSPATLRSPRLRSLLRRWHLKRLIARVAERVVCWSRLAAKCEAYGINAWVQGIEKGCIVSSKAVGWLEQALLDGTTRFMASKLWRFLDRAYRTTQQGSTQHALLWLCIGVGLLLGSIYWMM